MMIRININHSRHYLLGGLATLAMTVCLMLGYSIWQWHSDWVLAHQEQSQAPSVAKSDPTAEMITAIPNAHLFGKGLNGLGDAPITNLQLRVTGIVKSDDEANGEASKAYISMAGKPGKIYQVGDSLPYGVKIYAINADAVILENDGRLEKLPLPRNPLEFKPKPNEEDLS